MASFSMVPMARRAEQHTVKSTGVHGAGWESGTANMQRERDTTLLTRVTYGCDTSCSQQKFR